jgi:hypothetical protein
MSIELTLSILQNGVFIEPQNVRYLDGGTVLQTDSSCEDCIPTRSSIGGANYFNRESRIMHLVRTDFSPPQKIFTGS